MGLFDTIRVGEREGQVKCYDPVLELFGVGDEMPPLFGVIPEPADHTYSIAMREGGYVNVTAGRLTSWTDEPAHVPVIDKYGDLYMGHTAHGLLDDVAGIRDRYLFGKPDTRISKQEGE